MTLLRAFRPCRFADAASREAILTILESDPKGNDRSKFVRYGNLAATWRRMRAEGAIVQDSEPSFPVSGRYQFAMASLAGETRLVGQSTVPPFAKESAQRVLEATLCYFAPIVIEQATVWTGTEVSMGSELDVMANVELAMAATEVQVLNHRAGRSKPTDWAMVAAPLAPISSNEGKNSQAVGQPAYFSQWVQYKVDNERGIVHRCNEAGFLRASGPVSGAWNFGFTSGWWTMPADVAVDYCSGRGGYATSLAQLLEIRNADVVSNVGTDTVIANHVLVRAPSGPSASENHIKLLRPTSFSAYKRTDLPPIGDIMGHLLDI